MCSFTLSDCKITLLLPSLFNICFFSCYFTGFPFASYNSKTPTFYCILCTFPLINQFFWMQNKMISIPEYEAFNDPTAYKWAKISETLMKMRLKWNIALVIQTFHFYVNIFQFHLIECNINNTAAEILMQKQHLIRVKLFYCSLFLFEFRSFICHIFQPVAGFILWFTK